MGLVTNDGRVARALAMIQFSNGTAKTLWAAVGRTAEWPDPDNPPDESPTAEELDSYVGFKKIATMELVVPDVAGTIEFIGQNFRVVPRVAPNYDEVFDEDAFYVYLSAQISGSELPLTTYHQIGVFDGLIPTAGNEALVALTPSQVSSVGKLVYISNEKAKTRSGSTKHVLSQVIKV